MVTGIRYLFRLIINAVADCISNHETVEVKRDYYLRTSAFSDNDLIIKIDKLK